MQLLQDPMLSSLIKYFIISFAISYALTPITIFLAKQLGFIDKPTRKHPAILHAGPIPRMGGVAIFISILLTSLVFATTDRFYWAIIMGALINLTIGTIDDKYELSPQVRLMFQVLSAIVIIWAGIEFYISNPFGAGTWDFNFTQLSIPLINLNLDLLGDIIFIVWIVFIMNAVNWSKGVSQLPGVAVIAFLAIAGVALKYQAGNPYQLQTATLAVISAGATLAFLPFNFPPERMFPGFGGSTLIGFLLAVLSVLSGGKVATILIVLAIPIIDSILVGSKRILNHQSPLIHDREHLYHFLLNKGFTKKQIIYLYWITAVLFGVTVISLQSVGKMIAIGVSSVLIAGLFSYLYRQQKTNK